MRKIIRFKRGRCPVCGNRPRIISDRAADSSGIMLYRAHCCSVINTSYTINKDMVMDMWRERVAEYRRRK